MQKEEKENSSTVGKNSSPQAKYEYIQQNKERIVTDEEYCILKDYSDLFEVRLEKSIRAIKKEDENKQTIYRFVGFKKTEMGQVAEMMLAINHYYGRFSTERIFFDQAGHTHVLSVNQVGEAKSYLASNWKASESTTAPKLITSYVQNRWGDTDFTLNRYNSLIMTFFQDTYLCIDPFQTAVELRAREIKEGKVAKVTAEQFIDELSGGMVESEYEPYRERALRLLLKAPLVIRSKYYKGQGMQNMVIFVGKQGVGKSTLCDVLGLGYKDDLDDVSAVDQATAIKRATNVILENAELSSFSKAEIEKLKSAITRRAISILLKYQNTETKFMCNAVLIGTTNNYDFLKDLTGERRFLPIMINRWNIGVVTYDWVLTAYATEYNRLFDNKTLEDIKGIEEEIASKKSKLKRANINDRGDIQEKLYSWEDALDEALYALSQNDLNLNVEESAEDLDYKKENFGQVDKATRYIKQVIREAVDDASSEIARKIIRTRKEHSIGFVPKQELDTAIIDYISDTMDKDLYGNKPSELLLQFGKKAVEKDKNNKNVKVIRVAKKDLDRLLK